jgi:hypothetical protein
VRAANPTANDCNPQRSCQYSIGQSRRKPFRNEECECRCTVVNASATIIGYASDSSRGCRAMNVDWEEATFDNEGRRHVYDHVRKEGLPPTIAETASALSTTLDNVSASLAQFSPSTSAGAWRRRGTVPTVGNQGGAGGPSMRRKRSLPSLGSPLRSGVCHVERGV